MDNLKRLEVWCHGRLGGYHTTSINDAITPCDSDVLALAGKAGLELKTASRILKEMREMVN